MQKLPHGMLLQVLLPPQTDRVESTCIEKGHVDYKNSLTGETKTEELELVDHKYEKTNEVEATCTEKGLVTYTCSVCGDEYTEDTAALGHNYEWQTIEEPGLFTVGQEAEIIFILRGRQLTKRKEQNVSNI